MKFLKKGQFFGVARKTTRFGALTITDTVYPEPVSVPWHYHENPLFTFFLKGHVLETSRKDSFYCTAGSLLFSNCQEPHYNTRHTRDMHYFHVELENKWLTLHQLALTNYEGHILLNDPKLGTLFHNIYHESRVNDTASRLAIEGLLLQAFSAIRRSGEKISSESPVWVKTLREFIHTHCSEAISLERLANECQRSPVYLSQVFPKYFGETFGEHLRRARVAKAAHLLNLENSPLADVAYTAGFSDQSHFTRCFKKILGMTPGEYRKIHE